MGRINLNQRITYLLFFLFGVVCLNAQINQEEFYKKFNSSNKKEKVKLVADVKFESIKEIYPLIKDTLDAIKKSVYQNTQSKEAKFLFDKIDSEIEISNGNYAKAIYILENCLVNHSDNIKDSLITLLSLKECLVKIKDLRRAFNINRILESNIKRKPAELVLNKGTSRSTMYSMLGLLSEAIAERRTEFKLDSNSSNPVSKIYFYNDLGVFFNSLKKSDSAEFYFLKAKQVLEKMPFSEKSTSNLVFYSGLIDGNLGYSLFNKGEFKKAIPLLKNDVYFSLISLQFESALNSYNIIAECYSKLNNHTLARKYLDSSEIILKRRDLPRTSVLKYLLAKANYYSNTSNEKQANLIYKQYIELKDSVISLEKERQIVNEEVAFNVEQKEKQLEEKSEELKAIALQDAKQKTYRAYLVAGIFMLIAIIIFLVLNNNFVKKRELELSAVNQKIYQQNLQIENSLKEKELLIKEIHHRVKNNLQIITSMLSLQIGKSLDEKTESILTEAKQRIESIALTHQMLYQKGNLSTVVLSSYVEKLVYQIEATIPTSNIKLVVEIEELEKRLSIDNAVPLGLIINEILTNCYKHAFPNNHGTIKVALYKENNGTFLRISDNGVGLKEKHFDSESKSMGLELIEILSEQLNANMKVDTTNGTSYLLELTKL